MIFVVFENIRYLKEHLTFKFVIMSMMQYNIVFQTKQVFFTLNENFVL